MSFCINGSLIEKEVKVNSFSRNMNISLTNQVKLLPGKRLCFDIFEGKIDHLLWIDLFLPDTAKFKILRSYLNPFSVIFVRHFTRNFGRKSFYLLSLAGIFRLLLVCKHYLLIGIFTNLIVCSKLLLDHLIIFPNRVFLLFDIYGYNLFVHRLIINLAVLKS